MDIINNYEIEEITKETPTIKTFKLNGSIKAQPGQYVMVWIKGVDEIPISPSSLDPLKLTIQKVGLATESIFNLSPGDELGIRGPYGSSFIPRGENPIIIAGGCGMAPLLPLAKTLEDKNPTIALGAKNIDELLFKKKVEKIGKAMFATEDGSLGFKGFITDSIKGKLKKYDSIYSCGPEPMMFSLIKMLDRKEIENTFCQVSLHRYIKCGVGICGSCVIDPTGIRSCKEGPVFEIQELIDTDFGRYKRNASGKKEYF